MHLNKIFFGEDYHERKKSCVLISISPKRVVRQRSFSSFTYTTNDDMCVKSTFDFQKNPHWLSTVQVIAKQGAAVGLLCIKRAVTK